MIQLRLPSPILTIHSPLTTGTGSRTTITPVDITFAQIHSRRFDLELDIDRPCSRDIPRFRP